VVKPAQIIYAPEAEKELSEIKHWTKAHFGTHQANQYIQKIKTMILSIGDFGDTSHPIPDGNGIYQLLFRHRPRAHGHRIIWHWVDDHVEIIRIIHTSRNWQQLIEIK
jgi:plasmid stabilization system protein ParE